MIFAGDLLTLLLSATVLVFIAVYTVSKCSALIIAERESRERFLFQGLRPIDSLASNMGSAFSLTYLGATAIYAHLYGLGFLLYLALGFVLAWIVAYKLLGITNVSHPERTNILFRLLQEHYGQANLQRISAVYSILYFGLLVEEIAVSRVVLNLILPQSRMVPAALLATLLLVIAVYLRWGGYKAVLISDFAQLKLLVVFLLLLVLTLIAADPITLDISQLEKPLAAAGSAAPLLLGLLLFVPWLSSAPDFYSRLNYRPVAHNFTERQFISLSFLLMFIIYGVVALTGAALPSSFSDEQTPTGFARAGIQIVGENVSRLGTVVFLASIFCMIFTTIDTLLITYLQAASLTRATSRWLHRPTSILLLAAGIAGFLLPADSISAYGLFVGGLLIVPAFPIAGLLSKTVRSLLPKRQTYLLAAVALSCIVQVPILGRLMTEYSKHHLIGLLVAAPTLFCAMVAKFLELGWRDQ